MKNVQLNNNGNMPETLLMELEVAKIRLVQAQQAMQALTIHGRNYQTCADPELSFNSDRAEAGAMRSLVRQATHWVEESHKTLYDQMPISVRVKASMKAREMAYTAIDRQDGKV